MKKIDSHVHTHYSHGKAELLEMVLAAENLGVESLGFAEHFHYDYLRDNLPTVQGRSVDGTPKTRLELFFNAFERAKIQTKLPLRLGIEVDYFQEFEPEIKKSIEDFSDKNFDFVIGSVHFIGGKKYKFFDDYIKEKGDQWVVDKYFSLTKKLIISGLFDVVAHPELVKFSVDVQKIDQNRYKKDILEIIKLIEKQKIAVEINTSCISGDKVEEYLNTINPSPFFIKTCYEKNIPLIIGSDSHRPEKILYKFKEAKEVLNIIGVKKLFYLKERKLFSYKME